MNRIAICDDDIIMAAQLEKILLNLQHPFHDLFEIDVFLSGEELLIPLDAGYYYDIIFLDIEMREISGIDVAQRIRNIHHNHDTVLIFVSGYDTYHCQLYPVHTAAFIQKPPNTKTVREALMQALDKKHDTKSDFVYRADGEVQKVLASEIYYFRCHGRDMTMVTRKYTATFPMVLKHLVGEHGNPMFVQTHRSYVANIRNVRTFTANELILLNGDHIPVSVRMRESVKRSLVRHLK